MKHLGILLCLISALPAATANDLDHLSAAQQQTQLKACKNLQENGKLTELTLSDYSLCRTLLSQDLLTAAGEAAPLAQSSAKAPGHSAPKVQFTEDEVKKIAYCEAAAITKTPIPQVYQPIYQRAQAAAFSAPTALVEKAIALIQQRQSEVYQQEQKEKRHEMIIDAVFTTLGILFFLFLCWFFFFKVLPKLVYAFRKAWLQAAQDVHKK